jgi:hypothetical protein
MLKSKCLLSVVTGVVVGGLYIAATTAVALRWLDVGENDAGSMNHFFATRFVDMVNGRAYRPFVTRALVPGTIRVLRDTLPPRWQRSAQSAVVRTFHLRRRMAALGWEPEHAFEYVVFGGITLLAFAIVPFALRGTFRALFVTSRFWTNVLPLPLLLLLEPAFVGTHAHFMYDPATLALASLATWAALARRTGTFYVIYVLAVLNKETAFLLAALFLLACVDDWRKHVFPLFGTWLTIRLWLSWVFRGNPGSAAWWIPSRNIARALADPWGVAALCLALAVVAWSVWQWRSIRPIRLGLPLIAGVLLAAYVAVSTWTEYRVFYEVVPLAWVTIYAAVLLACRVSIRARSIEEREGRRAA